MGKRKLSEYQLRRLEETRSKFNELLIHFNYKHVEGEVLNSKIKIKVKCPANHNWSVNYESFKKGVRCPKCRYRESSNRNKLDSKIVIERYRNKGYKLLSEYKNNSSKVKAQCPQGHVWTHNPKDFFRGEGCFECRGAKKHSIDHVKKVFIDRGFIPLFNNYHNNKEKLPFFCRTHPEQGTQYASYSNMSKGLANCRKCYSLLFTGDNSHRWKGGISDLNHYLRSAIYDHWTKPSLEKYSFKCVITGSSKNLHVHHISKNFNEIVTETLKNLNLKPKGSISDYTNEDLEKIKNECIMLHLQYGLGVPLRAELHYKFHALYGKSNNNEFQFKEFRNRFDKGEFETLF